MLSPPSLAPFLPPTLFFLSVVSRHVNRQHCCFHRLLCVKPSGALSQGPSSQAPLLAFTNTSSAIKHNDSVKGVRGDCGGVTALHLTLYPSLSLNPHPHHQHQKKRGKKTPASHSCLHKSVSLLLYLCPPPRPVNSILIFAREKKNFKRPTIGARFACFRCTNVHVESGQ